MHGSPRWALALSSFVALVACGGSQGASSPPQSAPPNGPGASSSGAAVTLPSSNEGHKLAIAAVACWFGGVWGDAMGEPPEQRKAGDEGRCMFVVRQVYGTDDKDKYEKLRALETTAVADVIAKIGAGDAAKELYVFADAQREALDARRAGDKVKKDLAGAREPEKLTADEASSVKMLKNAAALDALLKLEAGELTHEAHALGVMTAMERIESSRGLPKHMKVYAMEGPVRLLFGVAEPPLPEDATQRLPRGTYLAYLADAAKAAGHPVSDAVTAPRDREPLAWAGVLEGMADKLRPDVDAISSETPMHDIVGKVVRRIDAQATGAKIAPSTSSEPPPVVPGVTFTPSVPAEAPPAPTAAPSSATKPAAPAPKGAPSKK